MINTYFFDLIKVAIGNKASLSNIPTSSEWKEMFIMAKQQTIVGILFEAIEKLPSEQRPPKPLLLQWFAFVEMIKEQNKQVNTDAIKMCDEVRNDGMRCMVLKGQGIATYYPDPMLRTPGDIDLWIEGGAKTVIDYLRSKGDVKNIRYIHADYKAPVETAVEIHYSPTYFYNPLYLYRLKKYVAQQSELFDNYVHLSDGSGKLYIPTIEFNRYYVLQHIYRHYFGEGIGLRQMLDYYYVLLKGGTEESKKHTMHLFQQTGMKRFVGATMWVMHEIFGLKEDYLLCAPHSKAGKKLLDEIMQAGNFGKYDHRIDRSKYHKLFPRIANSIIRKIRFITEYPQEILFDLPARIWMYLWRMTK